MAEKKEKLHQYSVRLPLEQIEFLKSLNNASQFIREAINAKRFEVETPTNKILLLNEDIKNLEKKRSILEERRDEMLDKLDDLERLRSSKEKYEAMLEALPYLHVECHRKGELEPLDPNRFSRGIYGETACTVTHPDIKKYSIFLRDFTDPQEAKEEAETRMRARLLKLENLEKEGEERIKKMKSTFEEMIKPMNMEIEAKKKILMEL